MIPIMLILLQHKYDLRLKSLNKCGTTNPTKPIIPDKETLAPTDAAEANIILYFKLFTFTPSLLLQTLLIEEYLDFSKSVIKIKKK